jgi:AcrR family transcriptional regulator
MTTPTPPPARPGRPRDDARDAAILEAALGLVAEVGYERVTMDAIANRARASKATIYRRWPGKAELVVEAFHRRVESGEQVADLGSLRADLLDATRRVCTQIAGIDGGLLCGLAGAARNDPELAACIRCMGEGKGALLDGVVARAVARGELAAGRDAATVFEVLSAVVVLHAIQGDDLGDALAGHIVDDIAVPILRAAHRSSAP